MKIAKALAVPLSTLIPENLREAIFPASHGDKFYAFCANPFCKTNTIDLRGKAPTFSYKSGANYPNELFGEINFCTSCGKELVKECPNCERRLDRAGVIYCITCGTQISKRPTQEDWNGLWKLHQQQHKTGELPAEGGKEEPQFSDDDIPF